VFNFNTTARTIFYAELHRSTVESAKSGFTANEAANSKESVKAEHPPAARHREGFPREEVRSIYPHDAIAIVPDQIAPQHRLGFQGRSVTGGGTMGILRSPQFPALLGDYLFARSRFYKTLMAVS